ncbi:MAG: hypothetical protein QXH53_04170 [Nitrososphaerales archaeon]
MPQFNIPRVTVEPNYDSLLPTLKFRIEIVNEMPSEIITSGILEYDVYLVRGDKSFWMGKSTLRIPTSDHRVLTRTEVIENFGLPIDVTNAMFEILKTVEEEDITLLKQLFKEYNQSDNGAINLFEKIIFIRDHTYPAHKFSPEVIDVMREINLKYPVSNATEWQANWDLTLRKFSDALRSIRKSLANIAKVKAGVEVT